MCGYISHFWLVGLVAAWAALVVTALMSRHIAVIDETRYLSVAWDMWIRGDWLVPHYNDAPYDHKPPLLFWLILAAWKLFGVSEITARLIPALAGLCGALLLIPLSRLLWPQRERVAPIAAWMVFTGLFWAIWTTATMFDLLLAVCVELALIGILLTWRGRRVAGWTTVGIGIGLGILTKGPAVLVYVLPAGLLAPWWMKDERSEAWGQWYIGLVLAVLLGAAIALAWALPAARAGGEAYANAILSGQTAGRMVESFVHRRGVWWYLPLMLLPWSLWPPLWRALRLRFNAGWDTGERFSLTVFVVGLLVFSLISGKQMHYLLPLFPALALLGARAMSVDPPASLARPKIWMYGLAVLPFLAVGVVFLMLNNHPRLLEEVTWMEGMSAAPGLVIIVAMVVAVGVARWISPAVWPGLVTLLFVSVFYASTVRLIAPYYEIDKVAALLAEARAQGRPVAFEGDYQGQFNFVGRLRSPIQAIDRKAVKGWMAAHPDGLYVESIGERSSPARKRWCTGSLIAADI